MKVLAVTLALLAASAAPAAAMVRWCDHPGQPCYKMKRTADISTEVKRSAEALAEAMAEAQPEAMVRWCDHPGQPCFKVKRAADAVDEVKRSADALAEAMAALDEE
ncbi:hypothetical protein N7466_000012 [Penicillium verhagenii]|uniref:uncharacterized protein n=1 Tax=Penicillium verhagenii TaxID=1562060 RepID=UPI002545BCCF|nr:uncharacterized protein N7466_000012 [Penicillium verhagenii]KAJ5946997.1 hypothetical protein N7466_000012 [Penicillium verhagenii]